MQKNIRTNPNYTILAKILNGDSLGGDTQRTTEAEDRTRADFTRYLEGRGDWDADRFAQFVPGEVRR